MKLTGDVLLAGKGFRSSLRVFDRLRVMQMRKTDVNRLTTPPFAYMSKKKPARTNIEENISLAKHHADISYNTDVTLKDMAAKAHVSVAHLNRKFRELYGITPYRYLMQVRMEKALALLKETHLPVNDIVIQVGLYSASSFIRMFRETYGVTPLEYRQRYNKKGTV